MVSFGHLDSFTLVNSFSDLRLDSFVYTLQSFQKAWSLVKPGGVLCVSFASTHFVASKMYKLLWTATGRQPLALSDYYLYTQTFVIPKGDRPTDAGTWQHLMKWLGASPVDVPDMHETSNPIPTDDWPFLFMREKRLSPYYLVAIALLLIVSTLLVQHAGGIARGINWQLFWLGTGFLLIETDSMTELGSLFGSTWMVNSIAVIGVLAMNLIAIAWLKAHPRTSPSLMYVLLAAGIVANLLIPTETFLVLPVALRLVAAALLIYLPLFFAGMIFTQCFTHSSETSLAFGSNLLGAMLGGCLEVLSTIYGLKFLWVLALVIYALSWLTRSKRATPAL